MSRALETAKSQQSNSGPTPPIVAGKNFIINGGMDIWQRGTSAAMTSSLVYIADRWESFRGAYQVGMTVSRQSSGLPGFQYCARVQRNSGITTTGTMYHAQALETINSIPLQGKTVTLSFWARSGSNFSSASNYLQPQIEYSTGSDVGYRAVGDGAGTAILDNTVKVLTTSWQRFSISTTIPSNATQIFIAFKYSPVGTASTNDYYEITGIQLEQGSDATSFSRAGGDIQGELAACERYFQKTYDFAEAPGAATNNFIWTQIEGSETSRVLMNYRFMSRMRSAPTVVFYSPVSGTSGKVYNRATSADRNVTTYNASQTGINYNTVDGTNALGNIVLVSYTLNAEL
jgi:hypothetical protein